MELPINYEKIIDNQTALKETSNDSCSRQGPDGKELEDDGRPSEDLVPEQKDKMEVSADQR